MYWFAILRTWLKRQVESYIQAFMPLVSVIAIVAMVAAIIGGSKELFYSRVLLIFGGSDIA